MEYVFEFISSALLAKPLHLAREILFGDDYLHQRRLALQVLDRLEDALEFLDGGRTEARRATSLRQRHVIPFGEDIEGVEFVFRSRFKGHKIDVHLLDRI